MKTSRLKDYGTPAFIVGSGALLLVAFGLTAFRGYGDNLTTYSSLRAWQAMIANGVYIPSRFQGNLPSELALGYLAAAFGPVGANAFSLLLSIAALVLIFLLFRLVSDDRMKIGLALTTIALNPYWAMASITSMDYMHPIPFFLGGILCIVYDVPLVAAVILAVAAGMRISYVPLGLAAYGFAIVYASGAGKRLLLAQCAAIFLLISGLIYVPAAISAHLSLKFLSSARPEWQGVAIWLARCIYKEIYLYGLVGTAVLAVIAVTFFLPRADVAAPGPTRRRFLVVCLAAIVFHLLLFLYIPVRIEYLMPAIIAVAGLFVYYSTRNALLIALAVAELSYWFVSIDVLRIDHQFSEPCMPVVPLAAKFAPHPEAGVLYADLTGETHEAQCMPSLLVVPPANIRDRLPVPPRP